MTNTEKAVTQHYGDANLMASILAGLESAGADLNQLQPEDLAPVEEFHLGGRKATEKMVAKLSLGADQRVLDIGCGIGGAARYIATQTGCKVAGIDLTPEYIEVARKLSELTGLADKTTFETGSALAMPFEDGAFDAAVTFHVAMNIEDREALYGEIARVLKPGAAFGLYDVMRQRDGNLTFPVPWASTPETSHLTTPDEMLTLLVGAGFEVGGVEDLTDIALSVFRPSQASAGDGPPPFGVHLLMGADAPEKIKNSTDNLRNGLIAPVQMIARLKSS